MLELRRVIRKIPLFSSLSDAELDFVIRSSTEVRYKRDTVVFSRGAEGGYMLVILSGRARVVIEGESGKELILEFLEPGSSWKNCRC